MENSSIGIRKLITVEAVITVMTVETVKIVVETVEVMHVVIEIAMKVLIVVEILAEDHELVFWQFYFCNL